jgi:glycosyltransferase involved in cell wall biosynthesis
MNIVQVMSGSYPPIEGVGSHVYSVSKALVKKGHRVRIIVRSYIVKDVISIKDDGIEIIQIPISKIPFISTFLFKHKVEDYLKDDVIDVIHFHSPLVPFMKVNAIKNILTIHSTMKVDTSYIEAISINAILNKIMGKFLSPLIENKLLSKADNIIVVSNDIKDELKTAYNYTKNNIIYIPNGINKDVFYDKNLKKSNQIVYIGRLGYRKGLPILIEAINDLKDYIIKNNYKFILSGGGHLKEYIQNYIKKNNLSNIITITTTEQSKVNNLLNESMFLIMNSTYETGPRTVLESMFASTPVIATKVGLLKSFDDADYINIREDSKMATIEAIKEAIGISGTSNYKELQMKCMKYRLIFDNDNITNEIIKIYEKNDD